MTIMRVLVTGGAGQLGRALVAHVGIAGPRLTLFDIAGGTNILQGDVNDFDEVRAAVSGHDAVVHAAALHGIHLSNYSEREFLRINKEGTEKVLRACGEMEVGHVVLLSSMSVYGLSGSAQFSSTVWVDENTDCKPNDANDRSKVLAEAAAEHAVRKYGIAVTVLRPGRFFVDDLIAFNIAKLSGAVDVDDVSQAVTCALAAAGHGYQVFCISSGTRFGPADLSILSTRAHEVIEERYPGATAAVAKFGGHLPSRVHRVVDISRAQRRLGFKPTRTFGNFVRSTLGSTSMGESQFGGAK